MPDPQVIEAVSYLLSELLDGSVEGATFVLNPGDPGILRSLDRLSAAEASELPAGARASVASHVHHLTYGLHLVNRWTQGENPFADADYSASWKEITVTEEEWVARRNDLRRQAYAWRDALRHLREVNQVELRGAVGTVVHLAYHLGAIRQMAVTLKGPSAKD